MRATLLTLGLGLSALAGAFAFHGCGKADEIFDCQQVCTRYRDCYQADYNVDNCRSRCRSNSESDPSVRSAADQCEACIGDKSCLSATFSCASPCGAIVP